MDCDTIRACLGKKMIKQDVDRLFPGNRYGVNLTGDRTKVESLKVIISKGKRGGYANEILSESKIAFVESPNRVANRILENMIGTTETARMHMVYNAEDFDYGAVKVIGVDHNSGQRRFIMEKSNASEDMLIQHRSCVTCDHDIQNSSSAESADTKSLSKRQLEMDVETDDLPTKRVCASVARNLSMTPKWNFNGFHYDSKLESRHACFFESLNIQYSPHCITVTLRQGDKETHYTPDFYLENIGANGMHIEIKPKYPHEEEWLKAELMATTFKVDVLLLYGNFPSGMPYANEDRSVTSVSERRHYSHSDSIRGILWRGKEGTRTEGVVWGIDKDTSKPIIMYRESRLDDRWNSPILKNAYSIAASYDGLSGKLQDL